MNDNFYHNQNQQGDQTSGEFLQEGHQLSFAPNNYGRGKNPNFDDGEIVTYGGSVPQVQQGELVTYQNNGNAQPNILDG